MTAERKVRTRGSTLARAARAAAAAAASGFIIVAGFQVFLALGAPWGRAAWGGTHDEFSAGLQVASALATVLLVAGALGNFASARNWERYLMGPVALLLALLCLVVGLGGAKPHVAAPGE